MNASERTATVARASDGRYTVTGHLVFETVRDLLQSSAKVFASEPEQVIDLSGVQTADSAGLALLIEWFRSAHRSKRAIRFTGVPAQLRALAKISEMEEVLPFA